MTIPFDNSFVTLSDRFYSRQAPTPVANPQIIKLNDALVEQLGLDAGYLHSSQGIAVLAGNHLPDGANPIAMAYAGHQFGHWVPQLGDGRAVLLGEVVDKDGQRFDLQLKGAGPTPYSRNGDGRAAIGPVIREYIVSEAMAALGVPTTRALSAVTTGEAVYRESALPGAVLTRVASSHIRVGTFQYFAARKDNDAIQQLTNYVIQRHYPDCAQAQSPALALLEAVIQQQANLVAQWQSIGFIHGVMNTDNASVAGITIDYGPCAFMDTYNPETVFSSIDHAARYAYQNQPGIAQWNMANFAQCLLPLINDDEQKALSAAQQAIDDFPAHYEKVYLHIFRKKLGLANEQENDAALVTDLLNAMAAQQADFTNTFRALCNICPGNANTEQNNASFFDQFANDTAARDWLADWQHRLVNESAQPADSVALMKASNPAYIPRNHKVEAALAAAQQHDYNPTHELVEVLSAPYLLQEKYADYTTPPSSDERVLATFCGT